MQHRAHVVLALLVGELLLLVGLAEESEHEAVDAGGGLYDVRHVLAVEEVAAERLGGRGVLAAGRPVGLHLRYEGVARGVIQLLARLLQGVVEDHLRLSGELLVLGEVEVAPRGDALELLAAEREVVLDVDAGARVVGELVRLLPVLDEMLRRQPDGVEEALALLDPVLVPDLPAPVVLHRPGEVGVVGERDDMAVLQLDRLVGADEELELHLLELARAERVVARRHLVAEALAHLGDAVGDGHARGGGDVQELREDRLRRLGTEVGDVRRVVDRADDRLEHEVERLRLGELASAVGAEEVAPGRLGLGLLALLGVDVTDLVGAHELLAVLAHRHRIGEGVEVAGGLPDARVHDDRGVEAGDVGATAHGELPPGLLDVGLQLAAERPVVPEPGHAPVDFGGVIDEAAALAQRAQRVQ